MTRCVAGYACDRADHHVHCGPCGEVMEHGQFGPIVQLQMHHEERHVDRRHFEPTTAGTIVAGMLRERRP